MNTIDVIIAIPLLWGAWQGFNKGLIITISSIAALLFGVWGSIKFSNFTADFLANNFGLKSQYNSLIAFAITFLIIIIAVHVLAHIVDKLLSAAALGLFVKIAGAAFGILKWGLIISIILSLYGTINNDYKYTTKESIDKSILYKPISSIAPSIFSYFNFENIKNLAIHNPGQ